MTTTLLTDHWHHGGGGAWWFLAPIFWIGVWILIIVAIRTIFWRRRKHWPHWHHGAGGAFTVLAERYARGEIDETEYRERLEVLKRQ